MDNDGDELRICANCRFRTRDHHLQSSLCRRRRRFNRVYGWRADPRACEKERSRLWRWFGFDTCGPEGRYWQRIEREDRETTSH